MVKNNKILYLDILKIIAIFFVIFNHTGLKGFFLFSTYNYGSLKYYICSLISIFCKFSVPIFLAVSGALLLSKEESFKTLFKKRILKYLLILIIFSLVYYFYIISKFDLTFSIKDFFTRLYANETKYILWYLYLYIAFLLSLPILRKLAKSLDQKDYMYLIILYLIFNGLVPMLDFILFKNNHPLYVDFRPAWMLSNIFIYPLIGHYLHNKIDDKKITTKKIVTLWILNIFTMLLVSFMICYRGKYMGYISEGESQIFHNCFTIINTLTIFITIKYIFNNKTYKKGLKYLIASSLSSTTLGIYLIHPIIIESNYMLDFYKTIIKTVHNQLITILIYCFSSMIICWVIIALMKKIPFVNKLI